MTPDRIDAAAAWQGRSLAGGFVIIYMSVAIVGIMALTVLVVDWGHVQSVKAEMMNAATAAARAGVADLAGGTATAAGAAIYNAKLNKVDGTPLALTAADVTVGTWNPATAVFTTGTGSPNAVKVTASRSAARSTAVPMFFGGVIGVRDCDVSCTAIATNRVDTQVNLTSYYNHQAFVADGTPFGNPNGVHSGYALSATLLGGTVMRGATPYALGPTGANNAVRCAGQTVLLPAGVYKSVVLLLVQAYGPVVGTVTLNNNDATATIYSQSVSDWCAPRASIPNEDVCSALAYRNTGSGLPKMGTAYVLSYEFPITSPSGAVSVRLPSSANLSLLAVGLTPAQAVTVR